MTVSITVTIDFEFLGHTVVDEGLVERLFLIFHHAVLEREVGELVLVRLAYIKEVLALDLGVADGDVVAGGEGHVGTVLGFEELGPGAHHKETAAVAAHILDGHILIVLGGVGTHLEPEHAVGIREGATAQDDVAVVERLATQRKTAVNAAIMAVFDDDVMVGTVVGILVGPGALATLEHDGIVVDAHIATVNQHILADIDVDGITARGFDARGGGKDMASEIAHILAAVEVVGPEGAVDELHVLHGHVLAVGDIDQTGTHGLEVGTLAVILAADPKLFPVVAAVAVDGSLAGDGEAVHSVGIDEGGKILEGLTLHAGGDELEVADAVTALEHALLLNQQIHALLEEERTGEINALGDDHHAAAILGSTVDDGLDLFGLHEVGIALHTVVGYDITLAELAYIHLGSIVEPSWDGCSVRKQGLLLFLGHCREANGHQGHR